MSSGVTLAPGVGPVGILGGTFDPVHHGHLRTALEVIETCRLSAVRLMPCAIPPHRPPAVAPAELRLRMLRAAVAGERRFVVDERELRRAGPSYTVDSLVALRAEAGGRALCLVLGADAFLGLAGWHRWREIATLAHLVVVHRPGYELVATGEVAALLAERRSDDVEALSRAPAGVIRVQAVTALDISASAIRARLAAGGDPRYLVPDPVRDLMLDSGCYRQALGGKEAELRA
jgi:nicotinate-nucleotide adenylyltransferase